MRFRQEVLNLLNSTLPFLNPQAQKIIGSTQHLAELIQSPVGVRALSSLNDLKSKNSFRGTGNKGKTTTSAYNPYSLFLVFYLLILASDPQSLDSENLIKDLDIPSILPMPAREKSKERGEEDNSENPTQPL